MNKKTPVMRKQTKEEKKNPYCRDVMRCAVLFDFDGKWIIPMKPCSRKDCLSKLCSILRNYMCLVLCSLRLFIYYNDKNRNGCIRCIQVHREKKGNQ